MHLLQKLHSSSSITASSSSHSNISSILNSSRDTVYPSKAATIPSRSSNNLMEATASRRRLNSSTGHLEG